ncbi:MAG: DNA polymerase [Bacilli bacterium]
MEHQINEIEPSRIAKERTRFTLQREVFSLPLVGTLLKKLLTYKLNTHFSYLHQRNIQWKDLTSILNQISNLIDNQEQERRRDMGSLNELEDILNTTKEQLLRMFGETTPYYYMLNNDIAKANNLRLNPYTLTNAEIFIQTLRSFLHREILVDAHRVIDNNNNNILNTRRVLFSDRDIILQLQREYMDNITLVNRLLSRKQRDIIFKSGYDRNTINEIYSRLGRLFRAMISKDNKYWSVDINTENSYTRHRLIAEVLYRIYNSIDKFRIYNPRDRREPFLLSIELADQNRIINYPINHLLAEIINKYFNPVISDDELLIGSDIATTIVRNLDAATKITFGPMKGLLAQMSPRFREANQRVLPLYPREFGRPLSSIVRHIPFTVNDLIKEPLRMSNSVFNNRMRSFETRNRNILSVEDTGTYSRLHRTNYKIDHVTPTHAPLYKKAPLNNDYTTHEPNDENIGGFFPFFNISGYDLSKYQIPSSLEELENSIYDDNCLIWALKCSGKCTDTLLREISATVVTRTLIPKQSVNLFNNYNLKFIIKKLNSRYIEYRLAKEKGGEIFEEFKRIHSRRSSWAQKFIVEEFGTGANDIHVCNIANRYFLDELTPFTKFSVTNRDKFERTLKKKHIDMNSHLYYYDHDLYYRLDRNGYRSASLDNPNHKTKFMLSSDLITELYIEHLINSKKNFVPMYYSDVSHLSNAIFKELKKNRRNIELNNELNNLYLNGLLNNETIRNLQKKEAPTLEYDEKRCTKLKKIYEPKKGQERKNNELIDDTDRDVFYADFETCVADSDGNFLKAHQPFMCCLSSVNNEDPVLTFTGFDCGKKVLDYIVSVSSYPLIYFHNLSYDINFLMKYGICGIINRNSTILQAEIYCKGISIMFKDSYGLLPMELKTIALSFKLPVQKEIFLYYFYSPERVEKALLEHKKYSLRNDVYPIEETYEKWGQEQLEEMSDNIIVELLDDPDNFDIIKYCEYYCVKDVEVLKQAINLFHDQLLTSFEIDCHKVLSISSIANKFLENKVYYPNKNLFYYSNHIRDFLLEAVHGGRVMCARNERHHFITDNIECGLVDFDTVSLYPSAMSRLYIVEGTPYVLKPTECNYSFLEREEITAYVVEILVTEINKPKDFALVTYKDPRTNKIINTNQPPVRMVLCDIELRDLVEFQNVNFIIVRGLYWTGRKDKSVRKVIKDLFKIREKLKKEGNSLQNTYKLLMNSIYGKTIQKAIDYKYRFLDLSKGQNNNIDDFFTKNLNSFYEWYQNHTEYIREITQIKDSPIIRLKETSPINNHFNNTLFGIQILAMPKHLMNRVMCLADDLNLDVYYQDTDSMHIRKDQLPILEQAFKLKYKNKELIGTNLCQFHSDFDPICKGSDPNSVVAIESYFLGKKCI